MSPPEQSVVSVPDGHQASQEPSHADKHESGAGITHVMTPDSDLSGHWSINVLI